MRLVVLASLYHWEAPGSAALLFPDWCPHRESRTELGSRTFTSEANQRARTCGRSNLGTQPRDISVASCGRGPLAPYTSSNLQVSGDVGRGVP